MSLSVATKSSCRIEEFFWYFPSFRTRIQISFNTFKYHLILEDREVNVMFLKKAKNQPNVKAIQKSYPSDVPSNRQPSLDINSH